MVEQIKELLREFLEDDEISDMMAKIMMKNYQALLKAGFSEANAIKIVAGQGLGLKTS